MNAPRRPRRIAFLSALFPAASETFVVREFVDLARDPSLDVRAFALRRPGAAALNADHAALATATEYLRPGRLGAVIAANAAAAVSRPRAVCAALRVLASAMAAQRPRAWGQYLSHFANGVYLGARLRREGFDAIHAHFDSAGNVALFANLVHGVAFTLTLHASDDLYYGFRPLLAEKLRRCRAAVTDSRYNVAFIESLAGHAAARPIHVVYNGVDPRIFDGLAERTAVSDPPRFLTIGNFSGVKGYPTVLAALGELRRDGARFVYRIAGDGNPAERAAIDRLAASHGVGDRVERLGAVPFSEVLKQLEWCDALLACSEIGEAGKRDGLPTVIMEAMFARRPVVATCVSDIPSVVRDGQTGFLIPERQPEMLAAVLRRVIGNFAATRPLVDNARRFAEATFDAATNHSRLAAILRDA